MITNVQAKELKFVQITDTNFTLDIDDKASEERAKELRKVIKEINKDRSIDFVIFTGNAVRYPARKELAAFFKLANKLNKPYYTVIGNKEVLRHKNFTKKNYMHTAWLHNRNMLFKHENYVFKPNKEVVFIVVDGVNEMMPVPSGYYRKESLKWLDKELQKYENKKVVIAQHFPVFSPSDKPSYDSVDADKYIQTLNSYDNVIAVVSGHFNTDRIMYRKGVYHISSPSFRAPYYKYKVIDIKYDPKYLFSSPAEFSLTQKTFNLYEPKDGIPDEESADLSNDSQKEENKDVNNGPEQKYVQEEK